jgi:hypothetical protein
MQVFFKGKVDQVQLCAYFLVTLVHGYIFTYYDMVIKY